MKSVNWRRGLLRVWAVGAIIWGASMAGLAALSWYNDPWRVVSQHPTIETQPTYDITAPDGAVYRVTAPAGKSAQDVLEWVKANADTLRPLKPSGKFDPSTARPLDFSANAVPVDDWRPVGAQPWGNDPLVKPDAPKENPFAKYARKPTVDELSEPPSNNNSSVIARYAALAIGVPLTCLFFGAGVRWRREPRAALPL